MLKVVGLHVNREGNSILQGIDLSVKPGETHVILGPNASGKSTFGRVIMGDSKFNEVKGDIEFLGKNISQLSTSERAKMGLFLSFQVPSELDGVPVKEFLFAAKKSVDESTESQFKFKKSLVKSLEENRLPSETIDREVNKGFSGGERKKLEMVSLLTLQPKLAILDEIDSGVDVDTVRALGRGIRQFLELEGRSVIIISHSEKILQEIKPSQVHIFCQGRITHSGGNEIIEKVHREGFDRLVGEDKMEGFRVLN